MAWLLDGSGEREFAGTGPTIDLDPIATAGGGLDNDDYMFIVAIAIAGTQDIGLRAISVVMELTGGGGGGALQEMLRVRLETSTASEQVVQHFAIRNSDIASQLDIESAPNLRCRVTLSTATFVEIHYAVYIVRSDNMPLTGDLVDFMEGGVCQQAEADTGENEIINDFEFAAADLGVVHRMHGASANLTGCTPASYNVFDVVLDTDTRVSASYTSVIRIGIGMAQNQCLGKDNTGAATGFTLDAIRYSENATDTGPFTPHFDGTSDVTATCLPQLAANPLGSTGSWVPLLDMTGNAGAGPDWWWRMNASSGIIVDVGSAQDRPGPTPPPINADALAASGDPQYQLVGPLPTDVSNAAIFFDGLGDFFEIGVNGSTGELVDSSTGTVGFFFSRASLDDENIVYSQGNDAYTAFWQFGMNAKRLELIVQTSAGNRVTLTGSIDHDGEYVEAVLTNDGSKYRLYDGGVEDTLATVVELGTGAEGDWFDAFTADQSAVGARADVAFTTETTGRASEIFIYDGDVLSAAEVAALAAASVLDGITGVPNTVGIVSFENVTFRNGAFADIRAEESSGAFKQVVKVNRCKFLGGAQGSLTYRPQIGLFKGPAQVQFRGCEFDLEDTPAFGRGGLVGTAINTALAATVDGSLLVSDCDFDRIGFLNGLDFLAPVMLEAAFGMTVEHNRILRSLGTGVAWRADAQRVSVLDNQIEAVGQALGGIHSAQGLNLRLGSGWTIRGNKVIDNAGNAINLDGRNPVNTPARNISILQNETNAISGSAIRVNGVADVLIEDNVGSGSTNGVELALITDTIVVRRNHMNGCALTAYIAAQGSLQAADVTFDRNEADGDAIGDGLSVTQLRRCDIIGNKLTNMDEGVSIGEISVEGSFVHNQVEAVTPFAFQPATSRAEFAIGRNQITDLGNVNTITVSTAAITVVAHYHTITATAPINLDTIDGPNIDGFVVILRRALFSSNITLRDGIDNLNLGADFVMDVDNDQIWLVRVGATWNQLARAEAL